MRKLSYFLLLLVTIACIDPVTLKVGTQDGLLVVDAWITDEAKPQEVKLSRSLTIDNTRIPPAYLVSESNASVTLIVNGNTSYSLIEKVAGTYVTPPGFQGVVGNSYLLEIETSDGNQYKSSEETILPVPEIDSLYANYTIYEVLIKNAAGNFYPANRYGFSINAVINDPTPMSNYYRWEVDGIFEYFSITDIDSIDQCWAPSYRLEGKVAISDDAYTDGRTFTRQLSIIPYDRPTYYQVTVRQMSMSFNAYQFWKAVSGQQESTGSIFDPVPSTIYSNIANKLNPDEVILGYFGASSVAKKVLLVNRFLEAGWVSPSPYKAPRSGNCRLQEPGATIKKPPGFP